MVLSQPSCLNVSNTEQSFSEPGMTRYRNPCRERNNYMKVKLEDIIEAIEFASDDIEYFLDQETGEIVIRDQKKAEGGPARLPQGARVK